MPHIMTTLSLCFAMLAVAAKAERLWSQEALMTIEPTAEQPRSSEGDIIELSDGRLCLVYTRFTGGADDHSTADIAQRVSSDDGATWSDDRIVVAHAGGQNVMSVSLLRLKDGRIALFYLDKQSPQDCRPILRMSSDEATTFGPPTVCIQDEVGYYVMNNGRATQLANGRWILPVALHHRPGQSEPDWAGRVMCYLSDDGGKAWRRSRSVLEGRDPNGKRLVTQEPGVVSLLDGRLMMYCRSDAGAQLLSYSSDHGESWTDWTMSTLASPVSPATIDRIPWTKELVCIWNDHRGVHPYSPGKRTPLAVAVSADDGATWSRSRLLETDPEGWYCYTSLTFTSDRALVSYCAGDTTVGGLNRLKVQSLSPAFFADVVREGPATPPAKPLLDGVLDYGRSFINTRADFNSPRFWVESRCRVTDGSTGKYVEFFQCGLCKAEDTFAQRDLFLPDNYDFLPVFSADQGVIFRRKVRVAEPYRDVRPLDQWWGGAEFQLVEGKPRLLRTSDEIYAAMRDGLPLVGQTEIRDPATGRTAVIEYPIKTINYERSRKDWQVDTGTVLLPDLNQPLERQANSIRLAHIAFRNPYWADFLVDGPTPVASSPNEPTPGAPITSPQSDVLTYHYSKSMHHSTRNALLALEPL
ncbi:MAG: exo-alpha-sialidase [Planctomycetes bacterium]|nr:exo-alpha-sialidase [Planctomycetota bacterium]